MSKRKKSVRTPSATIQLARKWASDPSIRSEVAKADKERMADWFGQGVADSSWLEGKATLLASSGLLRRHPRYTVEQYKIILATTAISMATGEWTTVDSLEGFLARADRLLALYESVYGPFPWIMSQFADADPRHGLNFGHDPSWLLEECREIRLLLGEREPLSERDRHLVEGVMRAALRLAEHTILVSAGKVLGERLAALGALHGKKTRVFQDEADEIEKLNGELVNEIPKKTPRYAEIAKRLDSTYPRVRYIIEGPRRKKKT